MTNIVSKNLDNWTRTILIVGIISILVVSIISWYSRNSGYSHIAAVTRSMSLTTTNKLEWYFDEIDVKTSNGLNRVQSVNDSACAYLQHGKNSERTGEPLPPDFDLLLKKLKRPSSNTFSGEVTFGDKKNIASKYDYFPLISGQVVLYGEHTFLSKAGHYATDAVSLSYGDIVTIGAKGAITYGVLAFNEVDNGIVISATSDSTVAYIKRYFTDELELNNGWLSRLFNDRGLAVAWSLVAIALSSLVWFASEMRK